MSIQPQFQWTVPERLEILATPIRGVGSIFERFKIIKFGKTEEETMPVHWFNMPVYLPEVGSLISLDTTVGGIARDFFDLISQRNTVMILKLYNLDPHYRRAVSWGNYSIKELGRLDRAYTITLYIDFVTTPSQLWRSSIFSPLRWFYLEDRRDYFFRSIYSWNVFIAFIDPENFKTSKKHMLWIGEPARIVTTKEKFIQLLPDGTVRAENIFLSFKEDDIRIEDMEKGYYICFAESFNDYLTNHPKAYYLSRKNINLVSVFYPVVHSPYDIVPFLSPYFINPEKMDFFVKFSVPSASITRILQRFEKFEGIQGGAQLESYAQLFKGFAKISKNQDKMTFVAINPSLVMFLIKKALSGKDIQCQYAGKILDLNLIEKLENENPEQDIELLMAIAGVGEFIEIRKRNTSFSKSIPK